MISAVVILTVLFTLLVLDYRQAVFSTPGAWLLPLLLSVSLLATEEVLSLLRAKGHQPIAWLVYLGNVCIPLAASLPVVAHLAAKSLPPSSPLGPFGWPMVALAAFAVAVLVGEMARYQRPGRAIVDAALATYTLVYIGLLSGFWMMLRLHHNNEWGMAALFSTLLIVKVADTGAFAVGKTLGRHKLTPVISPGKTWEGAIGGIFTACLTSWAFFHFAGPSMVGSKYEEPAIWASSTYGGLLAIAGLVGDLAESLLKRDMERKDSSTWLPGLGGVLDIIDAALVAGPIAWLCWVFGLVGPGV
jgi:phosphatidate cytidylyltransferase